MKPARTLMTPYPLTILVSATVRSALEMLESSQVRHLPVVNRWGELIGMVSDRDVRQWRPALADERAGEASPFAAEGLSQPITSVMTTEVRSVGPEAPVSEVIDIIRDLHVGAVPVVSPEDNALVGIVSYEDLLDLTGTLLEEQEPVPA